MIKRTKQFDSQGLYLSSRSWILSFDEAGVNNFFVCAQPSLFRQNKLIPLSVDSQKNKSWSEFLSLRAVWLVTRSDQFCQKTIRTQENLVVWNCCDVISIGISSWDNVFILELWSLEWQKSLHPAPSTVIDVKVSKNVKIASAHYQRMCNE